ncbi:hypothetical protein ACSBR1_009924 [Camellia fascicularis]
MSHPIPKMVQIRVFSDVADGVLDICLAVRPPQTASPGTPTGHFAIYVGEERRRFVVPTGFLSHPLFKMLLKKAYDEFGFEQRDGLVVSCSVAAFQEVVSAVRQR